MTMRANLVVLFLLICFQDSGFRAQDSKEVSTPSVSSHVIQANGVQISYKAEAGYMMMKDEEGKDQARVFYIAYTKDGLKNAALRPLTFSFNGGPGSSSVWLHLGALGPKRVLMTDEGESIAPPYKLVDNEYSWLSHTDLVFIDPMMTGFTRPAEGKDKKDFTGYENDIKLVGDFIYQYLGKSERWSSPKYICGESYGTTRAAGLSGYLQNRHGVYLNGLMLVSAIMNFQASRPSRGNDLPYPLYLPTIAATAWYHGKVDKTQFPDLRSFLKEVEEFSLSEYTLALAQGDRLGGASLQNVINKLHAYTGCSTRFIEDANLRLYTGRFNKELLRDEGFTVGRLDSRFKGIDYDDAGDSYDYDPSNDRAILGPYTTAINDYLRRELKVDIPITYEILTGRVRPWSYSNVENTFLNVSETLRESMTKNPFLKVWIANGYYDMATGYFATRYTVDHMYLKPEFKKNISLTYYEAGHMMYIHLPSLKQFTKDFINFIDEN